MTNRIFLSQGKDVQKQHVSLFPLMSHQHSMSPHKWTFSRSPIRHFPLFRKITLAAARKPRSDVSGCSSHRWTAISKLGDVFHGVAAPPRGILRGSGLFRIIRGHFLAETRGIRLSPGCRLCSREKERRATLCPGVISIETKYAPGPGHTS